MSTFLQMQNRLADDNARSDLTTQIQTAINRAILHYKKIRWWFMQGYTTFAAVTNQDSYGVGDTGFPTDLESVIALQVQYSGRKSELDEIGLSELHFRQPGNVYGIPRFYCRYNKKIYMNPIPNQTIYTFLIDYNKYYTTLSADSDTNDFLTEAEDLIEARAGWWLNKRIIKDREAAADYKEMELDAFAQLMQRNDHKQEGRIVATHF